MLAPKPMQLGRYVMRLDGPCDVSPEVAVTMSRMAELRRLLREGYKQQHAFAAAIAAHPYELPSGIETRIETPGDDGQRSLEEDVARAEADLALREAQYAEEEREEQRLTQEARERYA